MSWLYLSCLRHRTARACFACVSVGIELITLPSLLVTVGRNGSLRGVSPVGSSGQQVLGKAALRAVRAARWFPSAPSGLTKPSYTFTRDCAWLVSRLSCGHV